MKISKRSNGSYVLRVNQVEATISGSQSIKDVYELYEKLIRLVGDGKELKKIEPQKMVESVEPMDPNGERSRPEMIIEVLKKHGPMLAGAISEKTGLTPIQFHGAIPNCLKTKRIKRKKSPEGYVYSVPPT